jgi:hypothetical protein
VVFRNGCDSCQPSLHLQFYNNESGNFISDLLLIRTEISMGVLSMIERPWLFNFAHDVGLDQDLNAIYGLMNDESA